MQTSYSLYYDRLTLGQIVDKTYTYPISLKAETIIKFGQAVVRGTNDPELNGRSPSVTGEIFRGVSLKTPALEQTETAYPNTLSVGLFNIADSFSVMRKGRVAVKVLQDVAVDDDAFYVFSDPDPLNIGYFRKDDGGDIPVADQVPTGKFVSAALAGGIAILEINIP
jgi:hypothetical protein